MVVSNKIQPKVLRPFIDVQEKDGRYMILVMFQEFPACINYNVKEASLAPYNDT